MLYDVALECTCGNFGKNEREFLRKSTFLYRKGLRLEDAMVETDSEEVSSDKVKRTL